MSDEKVERIAEEQRGLRLRIEKLEQFQKEFDMDTFATDLYARFKEKMDAWQNALNKEVAELKEQIKRPSIWYNQLREWVSTNTLNLQNQEDVLQDHLNSHIKVAREQLTDKNQMSILKEFDNAIERQLKKLSGGSKPDPAKEYRDKTNVWIKKEQKDSKHWHPKEKPEELDDCHNCGLRDSCKDAKYNDKCIRWKPEEPNWRDDWLEYKREEIKKIFPNEMLVRKEDLKYLQFIVENEDFYDDVTPGDYKKIHEIWKRYLNDES